MQQVQVRVKITIVASNYQRSLLFSFLTVIVIFSYYWLQSAVYCRCHDCLKKKGKSWLGAKKPMSRLWQLCIQPCSNLSDFGRLRSSHRHKIADRGPCIADKTGELQAQKMRRDNDPSKGYSNIYWILLLGCEMKTSTTIKLSCCQQC